MANLFTRALTSTGATAVDDLRDRQRKANLEQLRLMDARRERQVAEIGFTDAMGARAFETGTDTAPVWTPNAPKSGVQPGIAPTEAATTAPATAPGVGVGVGVGNPASVALANNVSAINNFAGRVQSAGLDMQGSKVGEYKLNTENKQQVPARPLKAAAPDLNMQALRNVNRMPQLQASADEAFSRYQTPEQLEWDRIYGFNFNSDGTPSKRGLAAQAAKNTIGGVLANVGGAVKGVTGKVSKTMSKNSIVPTAQQAEFMNGLGASDYESTYGLPAGYLTKLAGVESSFNPDAKNPSGAAGLMQIMPATAEQFGITNPMDPAQAIRGAAQIAAQNKRQLATVLNREPTAGELYLAHQQGAAGATALLSNPTAPAVSVVNKQNILQNGGNESMSADDYVSMWASKFDGAATPSNAAGVSKQATKQTSVVNVVAAAPPGKPVKMPTFDKLDMTMKPGAIGDEYQYAIDQANKAVLDADRARKTGNPTLYAAMRAKVDLMNEAVRNAYAKQAVTNMQYGDMTFADEDMSRLTGRSIVHQLLDDDTVAIWVDGKPMPERLTLSEVADDIYSHHNKEFAQRVQDYNAELQIASNKAAIDIQKILAQGSVDMQLAGANNDAKLTISRMEARDAMKRTVMDNTSAEMRAALTAGKAEFVTGGDGKVYIMSKNIKTGKLVLQYIDEETMKVDGKEITVNVLKTVPN